MGCCTSNLRDRKVPNHRHSASPPKSAALGNRDPPPSVEEETVKEILVLSETSVKASKSPQPVSEHVPVPVPVPEPAVRILIGDDEEEKAREIDDERTPEPSGVFESEINSVTGSFSTATTVSIAEKNGDEAISKLRRVSRSPGKAPRNNQRIGGGGARRERASNSPTRRKDPTPENRLEARARSVRGKESSQTGVINRNVGRIGAVKDTGESSYSRSMSPASRTTGGAVRNAVKRSPVKASGGYSGMSPATRTTGGVVRNAVRRSPVKVAGADGGEEEHVAVKLEPKTIFDDVVSKQCTDSLDDPLVSLECFIFL